MDRQRIKKLGPIKFFTDLGHAIVHNPTKLPKIGSSIVTEKMEHIGKVNDIFGPVKAPYVSISLKPQLRGNIQTDILLYVVDGRPKSVRQRQKKYSNKKSFSK